MYLLFCFPPTTHLYSKHGRPGGLCVAGPPLSCGLSLCLDLPLCWLVLPMYRYSVSCIGYCGALYKDWVLLFVNTLLVLLTHGEEHPSWAGSWLLWRKFTVGFRCEWFSSVLQVGFYRQLAIVFMLYCCVALYRAGILYVGKSLGSVLPLTDAGGTAMLDWTITGFSRSAGLYYWGLKKITVGH